MKSAAKRWRQEVAAGQPRERRACEDVVDVQIERSAFHLPGADETVELAQRRVGAGQRRSLGCRLRGRCCVVVRHRCAPCVEVRRSISHGTYRCHRTHRSGRWECRCNHVAEAVRQWPRTQGERRRPSRGATARPTSRSTRWLPSSDRSEKDVVRTSRSRHGDDEQRGHSGGCDVPDPVPASGQESRQDDHRDRNLKHQRGE